MAIQLTYIQPLFDLHNIPGSRESIQGVLTTNYDSYVEEALHAAAYGSVNIGFHTNVPIPSSSHESVTVLKLHGSFDWQDTWPIAIGEGQETLWIPPGILKDKQRYPFNIIWGLARDVLACDVLRIIGCRLDGNDWDLVSLLFSSIHVQATYRPYRVEIIDSPQSAIELSKALPYLHPLSLLEIEGIGPQLVSEWSGGAPRTLEELTLEEREEVVSRAGRSQNWFEIWLRQKAELLYSDLGTLATPAGAIEQFLEQ